MGNVEQQRAALVLDLIDLDFDLPDVLRARLVRREDRGRVLALALGTRHLIAGGVLLALETLELGDQPASARFERRQLLELGVRRERRGAAGPRGPPRVFPYIGRVEHESESGM